MTWICPRTPHHLGTGLGGLLKTWGVGCIPGEQHNHQVEFTADRLATYLLTQNTVVERGDETEDQLRSWLLEQLLPFFADEAAPSFMFGGFVACHRLQTA
ncbi:MAG: hypothetical protein ACLFWH_11125 [Actinomycetota bacterium]